MRNLLDVPSYSGGAGQPGGQYGSQYSPFSLLSTAPDEMDRAVERSRNVKRPDRGFDTDPQQGNPEVANTSGETGLVSTPLGDLTVEGMTKAGLNMGALPVGAAAMGLKGLMSEAFGPYGVVGGPRAPMPGTPAFDATVQAGQQASMLSNPNISPQAKFGNKAAMTPISFMEAQSFSPFGLMDEDEDTFGGVMGNVEGGGRGYGGPGRDASGDGLGGYGGPEGVGRDNARGGGIGF
jgi:hypothetical protein